MKNLTTIFGVFASLLLISSCSKDDNDSNVNDKKVHMEFNVTTLTEASTRAYIYVKDGEEFDRANETYGVRWTVGDEITIFDQGHATGDVFRLKQILSPQNTATFEGKSYISDEYLAMYPAQDGATFADGKYITCTIPDYQEAIDKTFDPKAAIQLGRTSAEGAIDLSHLCASLYLTVEPGCTGIYIKSGQNNWKLAGNVTAEVNSGSNKITSVNSGNPEVHLKNIPSTGGTFFMSIIPSTGNPDFTLCLTYENGDAHPTKQVHFSGKQEFKAAFLYDLGTYGLDADGKIVSK